MDDTFGESINHIKKLHRILKEIHQLSSYIQSRVDDGENQT